VISEPSNLIENGKKNELFMSIELSTQQIKPERVTIQNLIFERLGNVPDNSIESLSLVLLNKSIFENYEETMIWLENEMKNLAIDEFESHNPLDTECSIYNTPNKFKNGFLTFELNLPIILHIEEKISILVLIDLSSDIEINSCLGLKLKEINAINTTITIINQEQKLAYLGEIPDIVTIDGAFGDWQKNDEKIVSYDKDDRKVPNPNLDVQEFALASDNNKFDFYFRVDGELLTAVSLPINIKPIKNYFEYPQLTTENDKNDFTTQNISQIPKELIAKDMLYLYIDIDQNIYTGYRAKWLPIGADFMLEITGKNGEILEHSLYQYSIEKILNCNSFGPWEFIDTIPAAKDRTQLETSIYFEMLELDIELETTEINIFYLLSNWDNSIVDASDQFNISSWQVIESSIPSEPEDSSPGTEGSIEIIELNSINDMNTLNTNPLISRTRAIITGSDLGGADLIPNDGDILSGTFTNVGKFEIASGITVYVANGVELEVYAKYIYINGTLSADGNGSAGGVGGDNNNDMGENGTGPGKGIGNDTGGGGGASYAGNGGKGGNGGANGTVYGNNTAKYPFSGNNISMGSGGGGGAYNKGGVSYGGAGGSGGGSIYLEANQSMYIDGNITANGTDGGAGNGFASGGGGGSGGGILICLTNETGTLTVTSNALLSARGGHGGAGDKGGSSGGGGGGGGRIKIYGYNLNLAGTINVTGGIGGSPGRDGFYGENATNGSYINKIIPEFHNLVLPITIILILFFVFRKKRKLAILKSYGKDFNKFNIRK
jgi:hypothetical protein